MNKFLICGLPRSRTAWFAKYFSRGDSNSICIHEPIVFMDKKEDIADLYNNTFGFKYVGISDSAAGFWVDYILEEIKPRTLIIERDIDQVEKSLLELNLGIPITNYCKILKSKNDSIDNELVMRVNFNDLTHINTLRKIVNHLTPDIEFDEEHFHLMHHRNIEVDVKNRIKYILENQGKLMDEIIPLLSLF